VAELARAEPGPRRAADLAAGLRLAVTTLTVAPVRAGRIDRAAGAIAMSAAPLVGAALGAVLGALGWGLTAAGATPLIAAALTITAAVGLTRGLHLDGLADTADGLASYRPAAEALAIMKRSDIGPFGVMAIGLTLVLQTAAVAGIANQGPRLVGTLAVAYAAGRLGATIACLRPIPAARTDGLGALVAGAVPPAAAGTWLLVIAAGAAGVVAGRPWLGPASVLASAAVTGLMLRHIVQRLGGVTGDVIGAAVEVATTVCLIGLAW
jgi:adenosylcobinamide-GDP ribazoletransferase